MKSLLKRVERRIKKEIYAPEGVIQAISRSNKRNTPVFVPCFNNPTYCRMMQNQLLNMNCREIYFVDNNSDDNEIKSFFKNEAKNVIFLGGNLGPRAIIEYRRIYDALPDVFCITDPDIIFNQEMPRNFIEILEALSNEMKIGKVGLALDISDKETLSKRIINFNGGSWSVLEWESQFWKVKTNSKIIPDDAYIADIDTTFALYNKKYFRRSDFFSAIRVAGRFTSRHDPWFDDRMLPKMEEEKYRSSQKYSSALGGDQG